MPSPPRWPASTSKTWRTRPRTSGEHRVRLRRPLRSTRLAALFHAVPPRADAGHGVVVAFDHLHRLALTILGGLDAEQTPFLFLFRRHPTALVTPEARAEFSLERLPGVVIDDLPAPAVLHQEPRWIPGIERGDIVA